MGVLGATIKAGLIAGFTVSLVLSSIGLLVLMTNRDAVVEHVMLFMGVEPGSDKDTPALRERIYDELLWAVPMTTTVFVTMLGLVGGGLYVSLCGLAGGSFKSVKRGLIVGFLIGLTVFFVGLPGFKHDVRLSLTSLLVTTLLYGVVIAYVGDIYLRKAMGEVKVSKGGAKP